MHEADVILDENTEHRKAMLDFIASKEAIAFVGAGLSATLGYPPWTSLLRKLREAAEALSAFQLPDGVTEDKPLEYADAIQLHFHNHSGSLNRYYAVLAETFGDRPGGCSEVQQRFVQLPFKGYVTTNYDDTLEYALLALPTNKLPNCGVVVKRDDDPHKVSDFLRSLDNAAESRRIAHLHGSQSQTRSIILSTSDYKQAYGFQEKKPDGSFQPPEWTLHRKLVWSILATRRLVFFGCGLNDPYLRALLTAVVNDLWTFGKAIHYAVISLGPDTISSARATEKRWLEEFGVQVVYYKNLDGRHTGLDQLVSEALGRCGKSVGIEWLNEVNRDTEQSLRPYAD